MYYILTFHIFFPPPYSSTPISFISLKHFLVISSRLLFAQYSITTGYVSSGHSYINSHNSIIYWYMILGSIALLFILHVNWLYFPIIVFSYFCIDLLSLVHIIVMIIQICFKTLCKFIAFNLSWIVSTSIIGFHKNNNTEKVCLLSGGKSKLSSIWFLSF